MILINFAGPNYNSWPYVFPHLRNCKIKVWNLAVHHFDIKSIFSVETSIIFRLSTQSWVEILTIKIYMLRRFFFNFDQLAVKAVLVTCLTGLGWRLIRAGSMVCFNYFHVKHKKLKCYDIWHYLHVYPSILIYFWFSIFRLWSMDNCWATLVL